MAAARRTCSTPAGVQCVTHDACVQSGAGRAGGRGRGGASNQQSKHSSTPERLVAAAAHQLLPPPATVQDSPRERGSAAGRSWWARRGGKAEKEKKNWESERKPIDVQQNPFPPLPSPWPARGKCRTSRQRTPSFPPTSPAIPVTRLCEWGRRIIPQLCRVGRVPPSTGVVAFPSHTPVKRVIGPSCSLNMRGTVCDLVCQF